MSDPALARAVAELAAAVRTLTAQMASGASPTSRAAPSRDERPSDEETHLSPDFPTPEAETWARDLYPDTNVTREVGKFRAYYANLARRNWKQTWRAWMDRAKPEKAAPAPRQGSPSAPREPKWYDGMTTAEYTAESARRSAARIALRKAPPIPAAAD